MKLLSTPGQVIRTGLDAPLRIVVNPETLLPRFWGSAWQFIREGTSPAESTEATHAHHIAKFYLHCDHGWGNGSLDAALSQGDDVALCEMLETFRARLVDARPYTTATVQCWSSVCAFIGSMLPLLQVHAARLSAVTPFLNNFEPLQLPRGTGMDGIRALPAATLDDLLEVARPASPRNPFPQGPIQWRTWLIVNLLYKAGLRRGESLLLLTDSLRVEVDVRTGNLVRYLNVTTTDERDERASRPSIKTDAAYFGAT